VVNTGLVALHEVVDALIKENKQLKKQVERLTSQAAGAATSASDRALRNLQVRISKAISTPATPGRIVKGGRVIIRRRPSDPATLERRRAALAKAREVLRLKREAAKSGQ
jgi:cell division septum initiation protein DivIVA